MWFHVGMDQNLIKQNNGGEKEAGEYRLSTKGAVVNMAVASKLSRNIQAIIIQ